MPPFLYPWIAAGCALLALGLAYVTYTQVISKSDGDEKMREIASSIHARFASAPSTSTHTDVRQAPAAASIALEVHVGELRVAAVEFCLDAIDLVAESFRDPLAEVAQDGSHVRGPESFNNLIDA